MSVIEQPIEQKSQYQVFEYMGIPFSVNTSKDIINFKRNNDIISVCLSAFLLKIDPTFQLNQFMSFYEDVGVKKLKRLSQLIKTFCILVEFLPYGNKLYAVLTSNEKVTEKQSYVIDVTNHFLINCEFDNRLEYFSILYGRGNYSQACIDTKYLLYINSLMNLFYKPFFLKYSIVFFNPSSNPTFGSQPNISLALVISGFLLIGSSCGKSIYTIFESEPVNFNTISPISLIVNSLGFPILIGK